MDIQVRQADNADQQGIKKVALEAFGPGEGPEIVGLVTDLLIDPSAKPLVSLVATAKNQVVGHVLLTNARLQPAQSNGSVAILAPLSVLPTYQNQGIGGLLIKTGLQQFKAMGGTLVFVLGYPAYYSRHGFEPAGCRGFEPSYAILPELADAWMVQELQPNIIGQVQGTVRCADALDHPKYWRE